MEIKTINRLEIKTGAVLIHLGAHCVYICHKGQEENKKIKEFRKVKKKKNCSNFLAERVVMRSSGLAGLDNNAQLLLATSDDGIHYITLHSGASD